MPKLITIKNSFIKRFFLINSFFRKAKNFTVFFTIGLCLYLSFSGCTSQTPNSNAKLVTDANSSAAKVVQIGYAKIGTLYLVKEQSTLDKQLSTSGVSVKWVEFSSPSAMLEAMNAGKIDLGHSGDGPIIYGLSNGVPLVYVAHTAPSPESIGILVRKDSPIKTVTDLKDKKVTFNKGSTSGLMVARALESEGMQYTDIKPAYLKVADSRIALERGDVDAWAIQDPWLAAAEREGEARLLRNGKGLVSGREFYFTTRNFANKNPNLVKQILDEIDKTGQWAKQNPRKVAEILSQPMGIKVPTLELAEGRRKRYGVEPINNDVISEQQKIADTFLQIKVINKPVKVADAFWQYKQ
jgi:sulfonate transport system substrate-binding protein